MKRLKQLKFPSAAQQKVSACRPHPKQPNNL
jgi:hypothetical protein